MQILNSLHSLIILSQSTLMAVREGDDLTAARTLREIIDSMENPVIIQNLKDVLAELERPL
jgi:hypothetical protein